MDEGQAIRDLMRSAHGFLYAQKWGGACHAVSSILHVCLDEIGVTHTLRIGQVQLPTAPGHEPLFFDHSWIEVEDQILDNAIAFPLVSTHWRAPVVLNRHIDDGRLTDLAYGVNSPLPLDAETQAIQAMGFAAYMDGWPRHKDGLWAVASHLLRGVGKNLPPAKLRPRHVQG